MNASSIGILNVKYKGAKLKRKKTTITTVNDSKSTTSKNVQNIFSVFSEKMITRLTNRLNRVGKISVGYRIVRLNFTRKYRNVTYVLNDKIVFKTSYM